MFRSLLALVGNSSIALDAYVDVSGDHNI